MDPFTSLSLATCILQIVDFGSRLVGNGHEIYKNGSVASFDQAKSAADDLKDLTRSLSSQLASVSGSASPLPNDEQRLKDLALETAEVAEELIQVVDFVARHGGKNKAWRSFRRALDAVFSKTKIDALSDRIDTLRNELILRVVVSLKARSDSPLQSAALDSRFESLTDQGKELARMLLDNNNFFTTGLDKVLHRQEEIAEAARLRHEETVAALATLRAGQSLYNSDDIQEVILRFLWFRLINDRQMDISAAYNGTFQWIFNTPSTFIPSHNTLPGFLRSGESCFWVSGKAGSGKSTLMKYIVGNPPRSYSVYGHKKSQQGLLRSILHIILGEYPQLVPIAFPAHCRFFSTRKLDREEPSLLELKAAFQLLATQAVVPLRICLFIDGIDEYDGDHVELVEYLRSVGSDSLKLVLSSRPTPACSAAFRFCPFLRLQDLTEDDIRTYVDGQLADDSNWVKIAENTTNESRKLVDRLPNEIVERCSGVFLWVVLVVRRLQSGLRDGASIEDLLASLDQLPTELEDLYRRMLQGLSPFHQRQASMALQIMYQSAKLPSGNTSLARRMHLLKLSFALDHPDSSIDAEITELPSEEHFRRRGLVVDIVTNRCCGLLEVSPGDEVQFIHKSVVDFLDNADVWADLQRITSSFGFDANASRAAASLRMIKVAPKSSLLWRVVGQALQECRLAELSTGKSHGWLLEEMDAAMETHWQRATSESRCWTDASLTSPPLWYTWFSKPGGPVPYESLFSVACRAGLTRYVEDVISSIDANPIDACCPRNNSPESPPSSLPQIALDCTVHELSRIDWYVEPDLRDSYLAILSLAVRDGADPNMRVYKNGQSSWQLAVQLATLDPCRSLEWFQTWAIILERLVQGGADICSLQFVDDARSITFDDTTEVSVRWAKSPLAIIQSAFLLAERYARPSMARKLRVIYRGLERVIRQRGGYSKVVVEEVIMGSEEEWIMVTEGEEEEEESEEEVSDEEESDEEESDEGGSEEGGSDERDFA
ncbi:hypothetical protein CONLIGDRAFT_709669 [Coniochaeta ligniaria NRRL 30616]|uniref:NACHT domain-containing protein n=1 Tax=Coniochaeta ligniaria NRRL 30616 TaxID=1408157 RepID=A0A1J7J4H8_9PEZI|nr:hypothetical protein CONLIGDRAFT_709669 [Coniochaeta ligniaria NRRL 30616]